MTGIMFLCATMLVCTGATLMVFLYAIERGVFQVTVQVAPVMPSVVLHQSAEQVFTGSQRRFAGGNAG